MHVRLINEQNNDVREVKIGFSWTLLFLSPVFGIPLFLRKLDRWAEAQCAFAVMQLPAQFIDHERAYAAAMFGSLFAIGCAIYLGFKGNELTAKNLLAKGWEFVEGDDIAASFAQKQWGLG